MNKAYAFFCRAYQTVFRAALPILPYREPVQLDGLASIVPLLTEKEISSVLLVTDASEPWEKLSRAETDLIAQFRKLRLPAVAVLNKIDLLKDKEQLIPMMAVLNEAYPFEQIVPLSAKTGDGVALLRELLDGAAVEGPHYFDDDMLTDQPERVIAAEILREKALCFLSEEIPHGIAVTIETMKERESANGPILDVDAVIYCERKSHKGIIIGKGGAMLKKIASAARQELEARLEPSPWPDYPLYLPNPKPLCLLAIPAGQLKEGSHG